MSVPKFAGLSGPPLQFFIAVIVTFGFVLVGYDQGVMSGILDSTSFNAAFPILKGDPTMQGFTVACYDIGCLIGALLVMGLADRLGRKWSMATGAASVIVGVIIQVVIFPKQVPHAGGLSQFIIGRIITGIGNGMNMASIPVYQAECLKPDKRGAMIAIEGGLIASGTMLAYWMNFGVRNYAGSVTWRFPIAFQIVLAVVYLGGIPFLPESPRWLLREGRDVDGATVCASLNREPIDGPETIEDCRMIKEAINVDLSVNESFNWRTLFSNGPSQHFRRCLLGAGICLMQQIGGCNAVIYFLPILPKNSLGLSNDMALLLGGVDMIVYAIFGLTSFFLIEYFGRRKMMIWGAMGHSLSMTITFACLLPGTEAAAKGAVFGLFLYIVFFGSMWIIIPWLYPSEINPLATRVKANSIACSTNWTCNFLIVMVTPIMVANIGWGTYLFFAIVNASYVPILYFFYPETRGRSLEEVNFIFAKGYEEKMNYVRAAKALPRLNAEDMEALANQYGITSSSKLAEEKGQSKFREVRVEA